MNARAKVRETEEGEKWELGSASAIVIDGEKIVVADMGEYKVVVCRDGKAYQINRKLQQKQHNNLRRHWCRTFIPGFSFFFFPFLMILQRLQFSISLHAS